MATLQIWSLTIDSDDGTFTTVSVDRAELDSRAAAICRDEWSTCDDLGPMPDDWREAYAVLQDHSWDTYLTLVPHDLALPGIALPPAVAAKVELAEAFIAEVQACSLDDDGDLILAAWDNESPHPLVQAALAIDAPAAAPQPVAMGREMQLPAALEGLLRDLPELISNSELQANPWLARIILAADDLSSRISLEALDLIKRGGTL